MKGTQYNILETTDVLNNKLLVRNSSHDLNNGPFKERTVLDQSNTELVHYSDPHFIGKNTLRQSQIQSEVETRQLLEGLAPVAQAFPIL